MPTPQDLDVQMFLGGVWTSVPTYSARPAVIQRGQDPGGAWPRPTKATVEINNDTLSYDPSNPESVLYGVAGRNTRTRFRMGTAVRTWAEATSWTPARTVEHQPGANRGRSATTLVAEGVLRRISTWTDPLRSPMYRLISSRDRRIGHWSLEDDREANTLANSTTGPAGAYSSLTLDEAESPQGAASAVKMATDTLITGRFVAASDTAGWQVSFSLKLAAVPVGGTYVGIINWTTSNGYRWYWSINDTSYRFDVDDATGTSLFSTAVGFGSPPTEWTTFRAKCSASGGTVTADLYWYQQNDELLWGFGAPTFAGTIGALTQFRVVGNAALSNGWMSHIYGMTTILDEILGSDTLESFNGFLGERARTRFLRLCAESGITRYSYGVAEQTQQMGAQKPDTLINLLEEIVRTDDMMIYDEPGDIAVTARPRRDMIGQTPILTLTYGVDLAGYDKIIDDLNTSNVVTIKNRSGSEYTTALTTGSMSTQPPPAGVGTYVSTTDVNVADTGDQLEQIANWRLIKGTLDRPRFASVTVDLLKSPGLETACQNTRPGDLIQVNDLEPYPVRLLVVGITETIGAITRTFDFATEPYEPYDAGRYSDAAFRYDVRASTLAVARDTVQTAWTFTAATRNDLWSTTATPYDLVVTGEQIRVTAMSAAAGVGPFTQTATVARSINGITKAHLIGEPVHIATPGRYGH
jgi:hypothetical protein